MGIPLDPSPWWLNARRERADLTGMFRRSHTIPEGDNARTLDKQLAFIEFDPSGNILRANEVFLDVMGYSASEIAGRHHRMFVDPNHANSPQYAEFWRALGSGTASSGEYPRRRKDGSVIWIQGCYAPVRNNKGQVVRVVKQAADITERKELELRNQSVLCSLESAQAVIEFDPSGRILRANPNFLGAVGYTSDEIVGRHHSIFMPAGEANKPEYKQFWEDLREGKPQQGEFERAGKGGRQVFIQAIYTPIFSADGTVSRVVKFADDITTQVLSRQTGEMADRLARDLADLAAASTQVNQSVGDTADLSQSLVSVTTGLRTEIAELGVESQKINAVIDLIRSLSDQTNLLALNATVEAVRAGEAGLGFNVVASEVKKLASETHAALATISTQVDGILAKVEGVAKTIDGVHQDSEQVGGNAQEVAAAMEQQTRIIGQLHESSQALLSD